ncbi:thymidine kinase [Paraburkholderia sp. UCT31]|uniref:thymidine kinase n=1 Tax=Paraburkholderia sp. UCT31 TaxID=2615209 RepID=UPI00165620EC|nr:thymidine kinase [Paraburkholderia sp. UCT31]MBC8738518.1 thymidine kinase [Paraburkholderia sp. UCT31]
MAKLYFRFSAMNAGKSIHLLQVANNYEEQGRRVALYTAEVDDRYGVGKITSRLGPSRDAKTFNEHFDFLADVQQCADIACLLVDEAQFLSAQQVRDLHRIAATQSIPVICYGLRTDFLGDPFEGSTWLLARADSVEELKTVCGCGEKKATMNVRMDELGQRVTEGAQVAIGGNSRYRSACSRCFHLT